MLSKSYSNNYYVLHDFGIIISIIAGFVFAGLGDNTHYILASIMLMVLSMGAAGMPYVRFILWPSVFALISYLMFIEPTGPQMVYDILIGDYNEGPLSPWLGLIYLVIAAFVIPGTVYAAHIADREEVVYGAAAASFVYGLFTR